MRKTQICLAALVAGATLVAGCSSGNEGSAPAATNEGSRPTATMEHIHGLGVDPADDALYAGTHRGLFRISRNGEAELVGDTQRDLMGFTVVGPRHFLASGHPGPGESGPSSLGLIESTDAGKTWNTLSLAGAADFHALDAAGYTVYGVDAHSGKLMATKDRRQWQERTTALIADIAVDPEDADTIVAAMQQGLSMSVDGGRSFRLVEGAPLAAAVDWASDGTLVAVTPDGRVYRREGATWVERGRLDGPPEAVAVTSAETIFASTGGVVFRSANGGKTFTSAG